MTKTKAQVIAKTLKTKKRVLGNRQQALIGAYVSMQERQMIKNAAHDVGLSVSAYIRHCVLLHQQALKRVRK